MNRITANRLSGMEFDEVSLVNTPANQHATIVLMKSAAPSSGELIVHTPHVSKSDFCKCKDNAAKKGGKCKTCGKAISMKVAKGYGSYEDLKAMLRTAYGKDCYVQDLSDSWVIFYVYGKSDVGSTVIASEYVRMNYAIIDGKVTFGEPVTVEARTIYVPSIIAKSLARFANVRKGFPGRNGGGNPNHDPNNGQFASGPGGSTDTKSSAGQANHEKIGEAAMKKKGNVHAAIQHLRRVAVRADKNAEHLTRLRRELGTSYASLDQIKMSREKAKLHANAMLYLNRKYKGGVTVPKHLQNGV